MFTQVRADYEAYRTKQQRLRTSDSANATIYEANLEAARRTYEKHAQLVSHVRPSPTCCLPRKPRARNLPRWPVVLLLLTGAAAILGRTWWRSPKNVTLR